MIVLCRGLHSLSRIGDELYVEPTEEGMCFRTVNAAQSAYSSLFFNLSFFSKYKSEFESEDGGTSKIAMKVSINSSLISFTSQILRDIFIGLLKSIQDTELYGSQCGIL